MTPSPVALPSAGVPGVSLRWLRPEDAHAWYAVLRLPEVTAQTSWSLSSAEDLLPILESWLERRKKLCKYRAAERSFRLLVGRLPRDMAVFTLTSGWR